jgi:hypothetical protein
MALWSTMIQSLTIQRMTPAQYRQERSSMKGGQELDRPILIEQALSEEQCEAICTSLLASVGSKTIQVQRKTKQETLFYDCTLDESLNLMMESSPNDSIFCFVEGLLDCEDGSLEEACAVLSKARESLFAGTPDEANWFDYFPDEASPSDCVVIAGQGATSTLHRDPFEWTGTSLCLEGSKIWRFLPPPALDDALQSYRLESIAWDSNGNEENEDVVTRTLRAGWQSDCSLYSMPDGNSMISARELNEKENANEIIEELAACSQRLPPKLPKNAKFPAFLPIVQRQGDLLLIPAYWYHQTYAPEPSLAVASQRCGSWEAKRVINHILELQDSRLKENLPDELNKDSYQDSSPEQTVARLFEHLQSSI